LFGSRCLVAVSDTDRKMRTRRKTQRRNYLSTEKEEKSAVLLLYFFLNTVICVEWSKTNFSWHRQQKKTLMP